MSSTVRAAPAAIIPPASRDMPRLGGPRAGLARVLAAIGRAFGSIFFVPDPWVGLVLGLALVSHPPYALFALLGLAVAAAVKRLLHLSDEPGSGGGVEANALLAAVVMGWLTGSVGVALGWQLALAGAAALPAALLAAALTHFLARSLLPAVLLSYCVVASMFFVACPACTVAASNDMPPWPALAHARAWGETLLRSLSALVYAHDWASGAFVGLAVLIWSRTLFACGVAGWIGGAAAAAGFAALGLQYFWQPLSYNFFIAGSALGAAIFLPGRGSLPVAMTAGALTSFFALAVQYAMGWSATSYLPLSSTFAIWVGIGALSRVGLRHVALPGAPALPPEQQWWQWAFWRARFGVEVPLLAAPVAGELLVSQGFGGRLSHNGPYPQALDFQRPVSATIPPGSILGADVTSPVAGVVERVRNHVIDNPPGVCNFAEQWGNFVVIRLDSGPWALLAHLQQGSIGVFPGMRVEVGTWIGRVGNSGRSAFAHLHMQMQASPEPGAPTMPFRLANYLRLAPARQHATPWIASSVPVDGEVVMAAPRNPPVYRALAGIAPGTGVWTAAASGRVPRAFRSRARASAQRITVRIDSLGHHVFSDAAGNQLVARLDVDAWRVVEVSPAASPLLQLLALAAPTIPYAARPGVAWADLPPVLPDGAVRRALMLALAPYARKPFVRVFSAFASESPADPVSFEVLSHVGEGPSRRVAKVGCTFSPLKGPVRIHAEFAGGSVIYSLLSYEPAGSPTPHRN